MTVHVLDTGAVFLLVNKHKPPLLRELAAATAKDDPEALWTPAPVLIEVGQACAVPKRRLAAVLDLAPVHPLGERVADQAAAGLRSVERKRCDKCSGFMRPSLVDAAVMAFAAEYAEQDRTIVYTSDGDDLRLLRDGYFRRVEVRDI